MVGEGSAREWRTLGIVLLASMSVGCAPPERSEVFSTTDSAGVSMAISRSPAWDTDSTRRWTIDPDPLLDLTTTGEGPQHEFHRVAGGTILSDGRIVIADDGSTEIRSFSPSGVALESVGEEGEGPGEYRQISKLLRLPGDSLAVFSWPTRLTILGPALTFVRTRRVGDLTRDPEFLAPRHLAATEIYPAVRAYDYSQGSRLIREEQKIVRVSLEGEIEDTIWRGPGYEEFMFVDGERGGGMAPLFGHRMAYASRDSSIVVGTSDRMELQVLDSEGGLVQVVRIPTYDLQLPDSIVEAELAARLGPDPSPRRRRLIEQLPVPETRPAFSDLVVDREGHVWVRAPWMLHSLDASTSWEIIDREGRWLGSIETPPRCEVLDIQSSSLLVVCRDELDVEHVRLLRLRR